MHVRTTLLCALLVVSGLARAQSQPSWTGDKRLDEKVNALLAKMTLEEKVGQLMQHSSDDHPTGPATKSNIQAEIRAGRCGALLNVTGAEYSGKLQAIAVKESRLGIPLIFGYDVIHGFKTIFPICLGQAASWDIAAIEHSDRIAAIEGTSAGIHWTYSPMVDIARDPRWGRMSEGSGEDPYLGIQIAKARVRGFQGTDLSAPDTMLACVKHYAGYGAAQAGRDYFTTEISEYTLRDIYLPPFKAAIDAGVGTLMAAFNELNGIPSSANKFLLKKILRDEWGFKGFVVSDWGSVNELQPHGIAASPKHAAELGFNAGVEMDMESKLYYPYLLDAVKEGKVSEQDITVSAGRILAAKALLGLLDDPYRYAHPEREKANWLKPEHLEAARDLARKSFVLLKNDKQVLPLQKEGSIALVGPLANSRIDILGSWRARGETADAVPIRDSFEKVYPKERLFFARGCDITGNDTSGFVEARAAADKADVVVAVVGESGDMSGEASSRSNIDLPGQQAALLAELRKAGKPVVAVVLCGRALALENIMPYVDAVLIAWLPGTMGGPAVTDVITGAYNPSGKLPVTFPRSVGQVPIFYNHKQSGRPQPTGDRIQYRSNYLDSPNSPLFPFGYGLSYTKFTYSNIKVSSPTLRSKGDPLRVTVTVKNEGGYDGEEVVQFYVHDQVGSVTRPVRELKGFSKVLLKKGESREVSFTLKPDDLAFWRADMTYGTEPGEFEVFVGGDSDASLRGTFTLSGE